MHDSRKIKWIHVSTCHSKIYGIAWLVIVMMMEEDEPIDLPLMMGFFGIYLIWFAIHSIAFKDEGSEFVDLGLVVFMLFLTSVNLMMYHMRIAIDSNNYCPHACDLALATTGAAPPARPQLRRTHGQYRCLDLSVIMVWVADCCLLPSISRRSI